MQRRRAGLDLIDSAARVLLLATHQIKQRSDIDSRFTQGLGRLGICHALNPALDLGDPTGALRRITQVAREHIHEVIDPSRSGFQLVTIDSVVFEVHERIARLRETRAKRSEVNENFRVRRTR